MSDLNIQQLNKFVRKLNQKRATNLTNIIYTNEKNNSSFNTNANFLSIWANKSSNNKLVN